MRNYTRTPRFMRVFATLVVLALVGQGAPVLADAGHAKHAHQPATKAKPAKKKAAAGSVKHKPVKARLYFPRMDPVKGMRLFVTKGCVACHAINGVGGHDHKALDAHSMKKLMNPFDFVAKMWRMAPAMIAAQEDAVGEQITFTGEEIAHIIGFVHDDEQQHKFKESMIPPRIRKMMKHTHGGKPAHQKKIGHGKSH